MCIVADSTYNARKTAQMYESGLISGTPPNCHICGGYGPFPVGFGGP